MYCQVLLWMLLPNYAPSSLLYDDYSTTVSVSRELTAFTGGIAIKIEGWDGKDTLVLCCWWNKLSFSPLCNASSSLAHHSSVKFGLLAKGGAIISVGLYTSLHYFVLAYYWTPELSLTIIG